MKRLTALFYLLLFLILVGAFIGFQVWVAAQSARHSADVVHELRQLQGAAVGEEKTRQELVSLRIENERKALFATTLIANLSAAVGIIAALSGAWIAFHQYLNVRKRESRDRVAQELNDLWESCVSDKELTRAGGIGALQHFLTEDRREHHGRILSVLAVAGRQENGTAARQTLVPVLEHAWRHADLRTIRAVSWQGLRVRKANLRGFDLRGLDLRDAVLDDADLREANLAGVRLDAASLKGARLDGANLAGANCDFTDFAGASLRGTDFSGASLRNVKILNADVERAKFGGAHLLWHKIDWRLARNWRLAELDPDAKTQLVKSHGPERTPPHVLMLLWEFPPAVAGGGWTAAYNLVRTLRRDGAHVTILTPWSEAAISATVFGAEVDVIGLGIDPELSSTYSNGSQEPYSSYFDMRNQQRAGQPKAPPGYGTPDSIVAAHERTRQRRSLLRWTSDFAQGALDAVQDRRLRVSVIHAHDWLTFEAARVLADKLDAPWIAHFHSTAAERHADRNYAVESIERAAARSASAVVTPSATTADELARRYDFDRNRVSIIPNSVEPREPLFQQVGDFHRNRVVFVGRLTWQKGPEHFVEIAKHVHGIRPETEFVMYGRGTESDQSRLTDLIRKAIPRTSKFVKPKGRAAPAIEYAELACRISVNPASGEMEAHGPMPVAELANLNKMLNDHGFTFVAEQLAAPYTHRIRINPRAGEGIHLDYRVKSPFLGNLYAKDEDFIALPGFLSWDQRDQAFEDASVVVVPSRHEPFGMVALEAMQHGVPVLVAWNAGVLEQFPDAIAIRPEDATEVARVITQLLDDEAAWRRTVDNQRAWLRAYQATGPEQRVRELWKQLASKHRVTAPPPLPPSGRARLAGALHRIADSVSPTAPRP